MDRNEHLGGGSQTSYFSLAICDQTSGHTGYYWVPNERYGHYLSTDTPKFTVGQVVQILQPLKVQHFFIILKNAGN